MGRLNTDKEQQATIEWGENYKENNNLKIIDKSIPGNLISAFNVDLKKYFSLAALSRSTTARYSLKEEAYALIFSVRVILEKNIEETIFKVLKKNGSLEDLFRGSFYGQSKKQGISVRMPLTTCQPTRLCAGACYAHDVLDAAPASVVRGAINGVIAKYYENSEDRIKNRLLVLLTHHTSKAIRAAEKEVKLLQNTDWKRRPYIRFSHVGEIAAYPKFANALAKQVNDLSKGRVDCVIYSRHSGAAQLDPSLWIVNFTLDEDSENRRTWPTKDARIVFSAFGGKLNSHTDINFLEHHRWNHFKPIGEGRVCPVTLPETIDRTCDAARCDRCFKKVEN
jgi:hypothetical protein